MLTHRLTIQSAQRNNRIFPATRGAHPTVERVPKRKIAEDFGGPILRRDRDLDIPIGTDQFVVGPKSQLFLVLEPRAMPVMVSGSADRLIIG